MQEIAMEDWYQRVSRKLEPGHYVIKKHNKKLFKVIIAEYSHLLDNIMVVDAPIKQAPIIVREKYFESI
jgi:hypothetical protein